MQSEGIVNLFVTTLQEKIQNMGFLLPIIFRMQESVM